MTQKPIHVLPINDLKEHDEESDQCWCNPRVEIGDSEGLYEMPIIIHNSADGREITEGICLNKPILLPEKC